MKLSISITTHFITLLSMVLFSGPVRLAPVCEKTKSCKVETIEKKDAAVEKSAELLHSEILFRY